MSVKVHVPTGEVALTDEASYDAAGAHCTPPAVTRATAAIARSSVAVEAK